MPKIVSETKREPAFRKRMVPSAKIFFPEFVLSIITDHADAGLDADKEILGLLIGTIYRDDNGEYAVVSRTATGNADADKMSVRFDKGSMEKLFNGLDLDEGESVVGWYHSHLDIGCFMSPTDIATQNGIFGGECGFAVVIDPVRKEMKIFDSQSEPQTVDMIIIESD